MQLLHWILKRVFWICVFFGFSAFGEFEEKTWEFFSRGRYFPPLLADPLENRSGINYVLDGHFHARLGSYLNVVGFTDLFRMGIEGGALMVLRQEGGQFPLETVDGNFGFFLDFNINPLNLQIRYNHVSAHLADGLFIYATPTIYSRETLTFRINYPIFRRILDFYVGGLYIVNSYPVVSPVGLHGGMIFRTPMRRFSPFAAVDVKWRQESLYNPCIGVQAGFDLMDLSGFATVRAVYSFYTGEQIQGQFIGYSTLYQSIGLEWFF